MMLNNQEIKIWFSDDVDPYYMESRLYKAVQDDKLRVGINEIVNSVDSKGNAIFVDGDYKIYSIDEYVNKDYGFTFEIRNGRIKTFDEKNKIRI